MRFSFNRRSTRLTGARLSPSCCAMRTPVQRCRLNGSISMILSCDLPRGERCGHELRSFNPATPCSRYRLTHLATPCRLSLNSASASFKLSRHSKHPSQAPLDEQSSVEHDGDSPFGLLDRCGFATFSFPVLDRMNNILLKLHT
jgi:hypothetical protein